MWKSNRIIIITFFVLQSMQDQPLYANKIKNVYHQLHEDLQ